MTLATFDIVQMDAETARRALHEIKNGLEGITYWAWRFFNENGYAALTNPQTGQPYQSFHECIQVEFADLGYSYQQIYKLKDWHQVKLDVSSVGESADDIRETHARILKRLPDPHDKAEALQRARDLAAAGQSDVTGKHIEMAVQSIQDEQTAASKYAVVAQMMRSGTITPAVAAEMTRKLDKMAPKTRGYIVQLVAAYGGLTDAGLLDVIEQDFKRHDSDDPSKVLQWLEESGELYGVPLAQATIRDWERAKYEAKRLHQQERDDAKNDQREAQGLPRLERVEVVLVRGDDPGNNIRRLLDALGRDEAQRLFDYMWDNEW